MQEWHLSSPSFSWHHIVIVVVQSPRNVWLFATPRTAARQASLSLIISWSLPKFMSIALMMSSSHLILWHLLFHWRREWQTTPVYLPWEPHELYKKTKRYDAEDESPRSEGVKFATGEDRRTTTNTLRKNEGSEPKQKWPSVVDMPGDENKIRCCKEQYCIGT